MIDRAKLTEQVKHRISNLPCPLFTVVERTQMVRELLSQDLIDRITNEAVEALLEATSEKQRR